jgi:hypothetical protein
MRQVLTLNWEAIINANLMCYENSSKGKSRENISSMCRVDLNDSGPFPTLDLGKCLHDKYTCHFQVVHVYILSYVCFISTQ